MAIHRDGSRGKLRPRTAGIGNDHPAEIFPKARTPFAAFTAPFHFAQGKLEVVPFHVRFKLTHYQFFQRAVHQRYNPRDAALKKETTA
jgi:hypothetical protein